MSDRIKWVAIVFVLLANGAALASYGFWRDLGYRMAERAYAEPTE